MTLTNLPPLSIASLLRQHNLTPKKSLGQNFLIDDHMLHSIVESAEVGKEDAVLEIGPGLGSLTRHLALAAKQVTAVELDQNLIPILRDVLEGFDNVRVIHGDMLKLDPLALMGSAPYGVIANIPYYITSALIRHLLESGNRPVRLVFTMQEEVAERICARDGKHSLLSLSVHVYGAPRVMMKIPAGAFSPVPKVDSATLRLDLFDQPIIPQERMAEFFRLAKAGFSQKRKNLRNSLSGGLNCSKEEAEHLLAAAQIDATRRAETLTLTEWARLTAMYHA